ncbi:hypothetical protein FA15DRAFT_667120 [Coprinopsis marcescibilis]|uniref:DH domain-containing protein n=1 Tax=Coprinopsis marcescibilis TaxID=230819 RepID=A0A5C3L134_COPMA|nr:hypothetical protein FA15DRAFT_667120 [Coprinopsis marcescibilis]
MPRPGEHPRVLAPSMAMRSATLTTPQPLATNRTAFGHNMVFQRLEMPVSSAPQNRPTAKPRKLQKNRRELPVPSHEPLRRTVSFDIASLSDNSHRPLINAQIASSARYNTRYPPQAAQRSVLRKRNRDSRPYSSYNTIPAQLSAAEQSRYLPEQQQDDDAYLRSEQPLPHPQSQLEIDAWNTNTHRNSIPTYQQPFVEPTWPNPRINPSMTSLQDTRPHDFTASGVAPALAQKAEQSKDKPLPPTPPHLASAPLPPNKRRWTVTSIEELQRNANDDLTINHVARDGSDAPEYQSFAQQPSASPVPPPPPPKPKQVPIAKDDISLEKLQRICKEFIESQQTYLTTLRQTIGKDGTDDGPPVKLILSLLSIVQDGQEFLSATELRPDPGGIANAYLATCSQLESHLLQWSREVSEYVNTQPSVAQAAAVHYQPTTAKKQDSRGRSLVKRFVFFKRKSTPSSPADEKTVEPDKLWQRSNAETGLWEMSVLPTQRTMRHAFLFKEMVSMLNPSHQDYQVVERALHASTFVAGKMARAQQRPSLFFT